MADKKILIVEDHKDLREFIRECLEEEYSVLEAENGLKGWEIATTLLPDLIVTDVAMPEMDGNEFCRNLKSDMRTSHIPVIMLTAKVAVDQQLEGLDSGADVYLTKPFNEQLLLKYIGNLLKAKEILRQLFSKKIYLEPSDVEVGTIDRKFMENLMAVIEANLSNSSFNIQDLSRELGMSKTVLYRKFNALVKIPIAEFLKNFRLKRAAFMLTHDKFTVTEVAWEVGFSNGKYFGKEFKKFFGVSPSEYLSDFLKNGGNRSFR